MPEDRHIYDDERHAQFITFSCYKRRALLQSDSAKRIVIGTLGSQLATHNGLCLGFVVMPEHVHCLVWFDQPGHLSPFMNHWKDQTSLKIKKLYQTKFPVYSSNIEETDPAWQAGYYPFNVFTENKLSEKLDYMHLNPVRRGLVQRAVDWKWSSARWYLLQKSVGIPIRMPELWRRFERPMSAYGGASCRCATRPLCRDGRATRFLFGRAYFGSCRDDL